MAKQEPSIVIDKLGTHLMRVTNNHTGEITLKWDWDKLLAEVSAIGLPTEKVVGKVEKVKKKDLVKETEAKVKKTRAKTVNTQITDAVTTKKPAAKKNTPPKKSAK